MKWYNETHPKTVETRIKNCPQCKSTFSVYGLKQISKRYCSRECFFQSRRGTKNWWGYKIGDALRGKPKSSLHIERVAQALRGKPHLGARDQHHPHWKGNAVGYCGVHDWVRLRLPVFSNCSFCEIPNRIIIDKRGVARNYLHLANLSGTYKRELEDWTYLCPPCHSYHDKNRNSIKKVFVELKR